MVRSVSYLTDDRDGRQRLKLVISRGNNGDFYVATVPEGNRVTNAVRLCTSGGASSAVPGITQKIFEIFELLIKAGDHGIPGVEVLREED